jgi:hypothetical protein
MRRASRWMRAKAPVCRGSQRARVRRPQTPELHEPRRCESFKRRNFFWERPAMPPTAVKYRR